MAAEAARSLAPPEHAVSGVRDEQQAEAARQQAAAKACWLSVNEICVEIQSDGNAPLIDSTWATASSGACCSFSATAWRFGCLPGFHLSQTPGLPFAQPLLQVQQICFKTMEVWCHGQMSDVLRTQRPPVLPPRPPPLPVLSSPPSHSRIRSLAPSTHPSPSLSVSSSVRGVPCGSAWRAAVCRATSSRCRCAPTRTPSPLLSRRPVLLPALRALCMPHHTGALLLCFAPGALLM